MADTQKVWKDLMSNFGLSSSLGWLVEVQQPSGLKQDLRSMSWPTLWKKLVGISQITLPSPILPIKSTKVAKRSGTDLPSQLWLIILLWMSKVSTFLKTCQLLEPQQHRDFCIL